MKNNKERLSLALIFSLFFLWAISSNLLPTMIRQLMKTCELSTFTASFTESAYWIAYFIFPIPIAMFMKKYSYKAGVIFGLSLSAFGCLLFLPAAVVKAYPMYLAVFFVIATGMCFLETAANPYVTSLGNPGTAPRRLNLAQAFNPIGSLCGMSVASFIILPNLLSDERDAPGNIIFGLKSQAEQADIRLHDLAVIRDPYVVLGLVVLMMFILIVVVMVMMFMF